MTPCMDIRFQISDILHVVNVLFIPITMEHALAAGALPGPHRDPFDRMLIAQGQVEQLPIITSDPEFKNYPVKLIW